MNKPVYYQYVPKPVIIPRMDIELCSKTCNKDGSHKIDPYPRHTHIPMWGKDNVVYGYQCLCHKCVPEILLRSRETKQMTESRLNKEEWRPEREWPNNPKAFPKVKVMTSLKYVKDDMGNQIKIKGIPITEVKDTYLDTTLMKPYEEDNWLERDWLAVKTEKTNSIYESGSRGVW